MRVPAKMVQFLLCIFSKYRGSVRINYGRSNCGLTCGNTRRKVVTFGISFSFFDVPSSTGPISALFSLRKHDTVVFINVFYNSDYEGKCHGVTVSYRTCVLQNRVQRTGLQIRTGFMYEYHRSSDNLWSKTL